MRPYGRRLEVSLLPLDMLASRPVVRIVRYLVSHPGAFTGRQLAGAAKVTHARALEALATLSRLGIVDRRRVGRAYLFSLNRGSYLVSDIISPAFRREADWLIRLGHEVKRSGGEHVEAVVLYGSWARGEASLRSDVDLLVLSNIPGAAREVTSRLDRARVRLSDRFGRSISFLVLPVREFRNRIRERDRMLREVLREGRSLAGRSLVELTGRG